MRYISLFHSDEIALAMDSIKLQVAMRSRRGPIIPTCHVFYRRSLRVRAVGITAFWV